MAIGGRMKRGFPVQVTSLGEPVTITLYPMSALEDDALEREIPRPVAPMHEVEGKRLPNYSDPEHQHAVQEWAALVGVAKLCRMIGQEQFATTDIREQAQHLQADFTIPELGVLFKAMRLAQGDPKALAEAAKERLTPTVSASESPTI